jgi:transposase
VSARRKDIAPLVNDLIDWMKRERGKLSRHNEVAKAMDYLLKRIDVFTRFLEDARICLSNNAAERELSRGCSPAPIVAASAPRSC